MQIALETLKQTTLTILTQSGYPPDEAQIVLEVLLYAQLRGNNQGIVKLIGAGLPRHPDARPPRIIHYTKLSALVDGGQSIGMVAMRYAADIALSKARDHGFAIVGTNNTNSSTGAIGYYAHQIALAGFIGLVFSGSGEYVAMHGSYEPIFGTNPLAFGIPTPDVPIVFDMATAAIARYGIIEAQAAQRPLPPDVAYDREGNLTPDPTAALAGAIRAFGGYKGAALALMVELLTGPLVGATVDANGRKRDWGNLVMVIDPELLGDRATFTQAVVARIARIKNTKRLPGVDALLMPGERGNAVLAEVMRTGLVEIDAALWTALQAAAAR
ncbi:MAG: Ldh family oxidoreductase [Armatimonadetes bacterium]|nr:Ldh family oxidoreductase [Anaerolineae bacterium]